jgi:hypothetical protein
LGRISCSCSGRAANGIHALLNTDQSDASNNADPGRTIQLVLLPWDNTIHSSVEFRCFIHRRRLCGISQYDVAIVPLLQDPMRARLFKRLIEHFHEEIATQIPYESCIMDIVVKTTEAARNAPTFATAIATDLDLEQPEVHNVAWSGGEHERWRVMLLEFNPFYADGNSGASLFDWKRDFSIVYHGHTVVSTVTSTASCHNSTTTITATTTTTTTKSVMRIRVPDPTRTYRGAADRSKPRVVDIVD